MPKSAAFNPDDGTVRFTIRIIRPLATQLDKMAFDPLRGKIGYGYRSRIIEKALSEFFARRKEQQKQQQQQQQTSPSHSLTSLMESV